MVKQETENGDEIVRQINAGLGVQDIDFSVQACSEIPTKKLKPDKVLSLCEQIVTEIFQQTGITKKQAPKCWENMVEAIMLPKMLKMTALEEHEKWATVLGHLNTVDGIRRQSNKHISLPPGDLGFIIAALLFRRLQPSDPCYGKVKPFIEAFGKWNAMQWLPVAVAVSRSKPRLSAPFLIEIDERLSKRHEHRIRYEKTDGGVVMVVTTRSPAVNTYEAEMREAIRLMDGLFPRSVMQSQTPDLTEHNKEAIDPGCDTTQTELPAPQLEAAANPRDTHARQEFFERYKFLWKGSLREHGSISGSLRGLVYQDCTDEQIFYLEETEKDFLAERMG